MSALVDDLAMRIPPSSCLVCQFKKLRASCSNTENKTTVLVFDPSTGVYTLKKIEDIDAEKQNFIYRKGLPTSAQSIKVQLPGETKLLAEVRVDSARTRQGLKHQRSLVDGFYIMPGRPGTQMTMNPKRTREGQLAELPAPGFFNQTRHPVELPADETSPVPALPSSPTPLLLPPRTPPKNARKAPQLLAPPPREVFSEKRTSYGSSLGSASIHIAYLPSHQDDVERDGIPDPCNVSPSIPHPGLRVSILRAFIDA
ncbi:hypothetical protein HO133_004717 [Letharia lupina]|uniref:Uncharacterized protein n=1 Tax=Letharia lupina TaxID=560253 RepID=A0A8H6FKV6_9LECA|nr:uncharacterized protein HO133_004717 [Letharia lupina]KAF6230375.1 hypothetical protein HO133_004717 [Letharia lupina]